MENNEYAKRIEPIKTKLYKIAYLYLANSASALDAVDEAVYKGLKNLPKLRQEEFFETWLVRILINECKKELKRLTRISPNEYIPEKKTSDYNYDTLPLKQAIANLPRLPKEVILLRYFSGYTLAKTAEVLNIPQGTVVTHQRKALSLLKLELKEDDFNG